MLLNDREAYRRIVEFDYSLNIMVLLRLITMVMKISLFSIKNKSVIKKSQSGVIERFKTELRFRIYVIKHGFYIVHTVFIYFYFL